MSNLLRLPSLSRALRLNGTLSRHCRQLLSQNKRGSLVLGKRREGRRCLTTDAATEGEGGHRGTSQLVHDKVQSTATTQEPVKVTPKDPLTRAKRVIHTLDPSKFAALGQEPIFIDTCGNVKPVLQLPSGAKIPVVIYAPTSPLYGFLYYHISPGRPEITGEIRFRVTPTSDPSSFSQGYDLIHPDTPYVPWSIRVLNMQHGRHTQQFLYHLLKEKLISPDVVEIVNRLAQKGARASSLKSNMLFDLEDPFLLKMSPSGVRPTLIMYTNHDQKARQVTVFPSQPSPFISGLIRCRFERSIAESDPQQRIVVMRCLEVLEPVVLCQNVPTGWRFEPGELVIEQLKHSGQFTTFKRDIDQRAMYSGLKLLW